MEMLMKKMIYLVAGLLAITPVFGQSAGESPAPGRAIPPSHPIRLSNTGETPAPELTRFSLDFSGGTPAQLVKAIEKASGKPLNAIIPEEGADTMLPPLKMNNVDVVQLFTALEKASIKSVAVKDGRQPSSYSTYVSDYGFRYNGNGPVSDNSIWYFHVDKPSFPPVITTEKIVQFYELAPFLDANVTVDDITTAIQTGWKMAGVNPLPVLNYHKETKLLIAYGEPNKLQTIENVLNKLPSLETDRYQFRIMQTQVRQLTNQVAELTRKIAPEEKSGK